MKLEDKGNEARVTFTFEEVELLLKFLKYSPPSGSPKIMDMLEELETKLNQYVKGE